MSRKITKLKENYVFKHFFVVYYYLPINTHISLERKEKKSVKTVKQKKLKKKTKSC